jgi:outer membrane lipoprotein-sorting protein
MSIFNSRPVLRWVVPAVVFIAVAGGGAATRTMTAAAQTEAPRPSPQQLLTDVQMASHQGVSGTVVERADLGVPPLPGGGPGSSRLQSLANGSHTMRIWYGGPKQTRVALLGTFGESDVVRNGNQVWIWDSQKNTATHVMLKGKHREGATGTPYPGGTPGVSPTRRTPQEIANAIVRKLAPSTLVTTSGPVTVAGRTADELVLVPRDTRSLVARVTMAVDSQRHTPLRVQVFARNYTYPAFEVAFTQVSFVKPDPAQFTFTPPPGATVRHVTPHHHAGTMKERPTVVGKGWTSIVIMKHPSGTMTPQPSPTEHARYINRLPAVSGSWGSGHLLSTRLFSVLFTDDGRVLAGAVPPQMLYQAAGR